jgi:alkanesulfonate monooxygenase SsuD/methylene tetrahydromethanopterin reductase-like flavin-dependent oxidoreductase (luciferase family)
MRIGVSIRSAYGVDDVRTGARWVVERGRAARDAGLDSLFLGDHHSTGSPYYQNVPMLGRLSAEWGEAPFGALFLLALWHPVLLAEQVGTLASLVEGPFVMQCALGGGEEQFAAMGKSVRDRVPAFEATLDAVRRLLAGEEVDGARIGPLPPRPVDVWIGASAAKAIDRAARLGDGWIAGPELTVADARAQLDAYRDACARHGRPVGATVIRRDVHVGADAADARRVAGPVVDAGYRGFPPGAPVVGGPDQVTEAFAELAAGVLRRAGPAPGGGPGRGAGLLRPARRGPGGPGRHLGVARKGTPGSAKGRTGAAGLPPAGGREMVRPMSKRMGPAVLGLALLAAGCSHGVGEGDAGSNRAALSEVCGEVGGPVPPVRTTPARPDKRPRLTDPSAHISYLQAGDPWQPWTRAISPGHLGALFETGYYLITQAATPTGEYYASVLSGRVYPGQQAHPDLECVAAQVADDLHTAAYPGPNRLSESTGKAMTVGGRQAYLTRFRIDYDDIKGYAANSEAVTILVVDTGRADLAILYASIPDTAREYEPLVDQVVASVQLS